LTREGCVWEIAKLFRILQARVGWLKPHLRKESILGAAGTGIGSEELRIVFARIIQFVAENSELCIILEYDSAGTEFVGILMCKGKSVKIDSAKHPFVFHRKYGILGSQALSE